MRDGRITAFDLAGNTAADALAVTGACQVMTGDGDRRQAWIRTSVAVSVQRMMIEILLARNMATVNAHRESDSDDEAGEADKEHQDDVSDADSEDDDEYPYVGEEASESSSSEYEMEPD